MKEKNYNWNAWVVQSVKHPTLDSGSGHDLTVCEIKPPIRLCADSMEPAWYSHPVSLLLPLSLSLSLKINELKKSKYSVC